MRRISVASAAALVGILAQTPVVQPQAPAPYSVLTRDGRRPLAVRSIGGQEMVALDDLVKLFDLTTREDALAGGLTVSTKTQTIALTPGQALASVGGRVISLPAPPTREGRAWYVPLDFIPRALGPALGTRLELRRASRLVVVGDARAPRITVRIEPQAAHTRLAFEVAPATPHTVAQESNRLLVRFEADALDATLPAPPGSDLVQAIRQADTAIAIDLGPRFASFRSSDAPGERGAGRILIDVLAATTDTAPATPSTTPGTPPAPADPPILDLTPAGGLRTIVIDAGHGGNEPGARGPQGTAEKDVTLSVARKLKAAIEARLGARVILTRDGDQTVGLDERAAVANNNKSDLFVSLHANASVRPSVSGAEVFYLNLADYGEQAQRVAQGNSEALPTFSGGTRDIEVILWEMAQARHIEQSTALAQLVEAALRERIPMSPRAIQNAPFRVLVGANMPAVLIEMGFITNAEQEKQLASDSFQSSIVQAVVEAVVRFRDSGAGRRASPAASPAPGSRN
ncbi:MAG: N-acetylmuramoyl-L-alanine amidase [Vicinamibacterales bacterium]